MSNGAQVPWGQYRKTPEKKNPWEKYRRHARPPIGTPGVHTETVISPQAPPMSASRRFIEGMATESGNVMGMPKAIWQAFSMEPQTDEETGYLEAMKVAPRPPGMSPQMMLGIKRMFVDPAVETGGEAVEALKEGEYAKGTLYGLAAPLPGVNVAVPEIYEASEAGDVAGAMGRGLVFGGLIALAEPRVRTRIAKAAKKLGAVAETRLNLRRTKLAKAELTEVASPTPKNMKQFQADLEIGLNDLTEGIREQGGFKTEGGKRVAELSDIANRRAQSIWKEGHEPMIRRHAQVPVDVDGMRTRILGEIERADRLTAPAESFRAQKWAEFAFRDPMNLTAADNMIRRLNAAMKNLPEKYGDIGKRIRQRAVEALRAEVDRTLELRGEPGVRELNRRFGAMRNIADTFERRIKWAETVAAHPITKSFAARHALTAAAGGILGGPGGALVVPAITAGSEMAIAARRAPGAKLGRAGKRLVRSQPPQAIAPDIAHQIPMRRLTEGSTRLGVGEIPSGVRGLEPRSIVIRDPKTGRFKKIYLGETVGEMMKAH